LGQSGTALLHVVRSVHDPEQTSTINSVATCM
jgi:hypothetical protein